MRKIYIEEAHGGYTVSPVNEDIQICTDFAGVVDYVVKYFESSDPENYEFADEKKEA